MSKHFNVIAGKNDSGKSAFLEAFRVLLTGIAAAPFPNEDIHDDTHSFEIHFIADGSSKEFGERLHIGEFENKEIRIKCVFTRSGSNFKYEFSDGGSNEEYASSGGAFSSNRLDTPLFVFDADRILKQPSRVGAEALVRQSISGDNAASIVDDITNSSNQNNKEFNDVMIELFGYTVGALNSSNEQKIIGRSNKYGTSVKANRMGSGISEVAYLLAHVISSRKGVFLIDEIEKSLHPELLKKLLEVLRKKSTENELQFIVGTHSNIVLTQLGSMPESKVYKTEIANDLSNIQPVSQPAERQALLVDLGYALGDLGLYDGFILTEEGTAQTFLERIIIPKFFPNLDRKVKIIASEGAGDVSPRYNLLGKLYVFQYLNGSYASKTWVICDGDEAGKEVIAKLKSDFPKFQNNFYQLEEGKSIEHYYPQAVVENFLKTNELNNLHDLLNIKDWTEKTTLKTNLLKSVLNAEQEGPDFFKDNAAGVIEILKKIKL